MAAELGEVLEKTVGEAFNYSRDEEARVAGFHGVHHAGVSLCPAECVFPCWEVDAYSLCR